jgi:hypothetical protein
MFDGERNNVSRSRVVIFEGAPGAGKSSLSQFVAQQFKLSGYETVWLEEHELNDSWFGSFFDALDTARSDAIAAALDCWRALLAQIEADQRVYLIDGVYFHTALKCLLAYRYSSEQIEAYLVDLYKLLDPFKPILVHLTGDVATIMEYVIADRGQAWAANVAEAIADYPSQAGSDRSVAAMIGFFAASQAELTRIAQGYPFQYWPIDTTARDWPSYQEALAQRLDLPQIEAPQPQAEALDLAEYVGVYHTPEGFPEQFRHPLEVELTEGSLRLHMVFMRNFRLIASQKDHFAIAARPLTVEFVRNDEGKLIGLIYPFVPEQRFFCPKAD